MSFLKLRNISKNFGGIQALQNVSLEVLKGEIHGICGENGAGKSTLIKILSGVYPSGSFEGSLSLEERTLHFRHIHDAKKAGIAVIHQELSLVKQLSIGENIFLGREPQRFGIINYETIHSESVKFLQQLGLKTDSRLPLQDLGIGEQQLVEIAKALGKKVSILILDEPTTALAEREVQKLMTIIRELKSKGVTIIYISHKLNEVMSLCDRITVMRDGQIVSTHSTKDLSEKDLVTLMVGREIKDFYPRAAPQAGEEVLSVQHLTLSDPGNTGKERVKDISFHVRRGELLGVAGLMGAGRTELLIGIFGAWKGKTSGRIFLNSKEVKFKSPAEAIRSGLALVSEDRKRFGLILQQSVGKNLNLASLRDIAVRGLIRFTRELKRSFETIQSIGIKVKNPEQAANTLSGGNQQKVVLGKWLLTNPDVLFLDEPTRGIDVGAKSEIYQLMNRLLAKGKAIVMVSSDLPEILGMSDRLMVLHEGEMAAQLDARSTTQEEVMLAATGQKLK